MSPDVKVALIVTGTVLLTMLVTRIGQSLYHRRKAKSESQYEVVG